MAKAAAFHDEAQRNYNDPKARQPAIEKEVQARMDADAIYDTAFQRKTAKECWDGVHLSSENVHLYRAAVLAWRKAEIEERSRHADLRLSNPHVANRAAALAVKALAPEMTFGQARLIAEQATNWAAQAHHKWLWRGIPDNGYGL